MNSLSHVLFNFKLAAGLLLISNAVSAVTLADQPVFASSDVPGNLALALSVEYPTAISVANLGSYADANEYLGYFDPQKCYIYRLNTAQPTQSYFESDVIATGANKHSCDGTKWSGNFMNWATMQTIDPFRWALSGGFRSVDEVGTTIIEKAWGSNQGGQQNFPLRGTDQGGGHNLPRALVSTVTPYIGTTLNTRVWGRGNRMVFSNIGTAYRDEVNPPDYQSGQTQGTFQVYIRVKVCDPNSGGGLEANCMQYGSNYKPEGLLQRYSDKIRYSAFSYLNANGDTQQGGVMRAQMGFIGPTYPQSLSGNVVDNVRKEWSATTGIMSTNPDKDLASDSKVKYSGVMNYLNKFGQADRTYMTYDAVSELYYAVLRYYENLGNVAEWSADRKIQKLEDFPAPISWENKDPILYSCQKNFILGIGDNNTHFDVNVGGGTLTNNRPKPAGVSSDKFNQASTWTNSIEELEGLTSRAGAWDDKGSQYIAGLAYGAHVNDIRPDIIGNQTISTYWVDVMENQVARDRNPYWLATKYGGFSVPANYTLGTPLTQNLWNSTGEMISMGGTSRPRPDNYYLASNAEQMVDGLTTAFANIANAIKAYTTAFSFVAPQVSTIGSASYASQYDSQGWTGVVTASTVSFASDGTPAAATAWVTSNTLEAQLANDGWDTGRRIVTWSNNQGVPFRYESLGPNLRDDLKTSYVSGNDARIYLNYLRGDRTYEKSSKAQGNSKVYRVRNLLLGDIVNSKVTPVGAPQLTLAESINVGYTAFKSTYANRQTMVYVGANDGMLHAFYGALSGATAGKEAFAYIPSALFAGPNGTPEIDGLASLGRPDYTHHFFVDATPVAFDIDFNRAGGVSTTTSAGSSNWRTLLIGGLGKGGKSYYALDVTDPRTMTSEASVASNVKWEFTDATMGYSYGAPVVVKTKKYGWVVVFTSGYNNSDGRGYLYFVNPRDGKLLEKISTPNAAPGMTHASAYVQDYSDGTADAFYVGDLNGQLWRFDVTTTTGYYPAPTRLALASDGTNVQPITTAPLIEIQPISKKRYILFGTGQLLDATDVNSSRLQTFYAIRDGDVASFRTPLSSPVTRADLAAVTNLSLGATLSPMSMGWYLDLGVMSGIGLRMVNAPTVYNGVIAFSALQTTGDACSPGGVSRLYAIDFLAGKSALVDAVPYVNSDKTSTDLRFISVNGNSRLIAGDAGGALKKINVVPSPGIGLRILNWREVPTID